VRLLENPIRGYAWGSRTAIARLQGRPAPTGAPEAELWIGAHADDPSRAEGIGLDKRIAADPEELLGAPAARRFGARLPFSTRIFVVATHAPLRRAYTGRGKDMRVRGGFARR